LDLAPIFAYIVIKDFLAEYEFMNLARQFAPCPKCQQSNARQMSFTWWGGLIGPKILTHVKCQTCGATFNGKSGKDNTTNIIIYSVVVIAIGIALFIGLFAIVIIISMAPR
jgi:uncharacterized protein (DUF983 family)